MIIFLSLGSGSLSWVKRRLQFWALKCQYATGQESNYKKNCKNVKKKCTKLRSTNCARRILGSVQSPSYRTQSVSLQHYYSSRIIAIFNCLRHRYQSGIRVKIRPPKLTNSEIYKVLHSLLFFLRLCGYLSLSVWI